MIEFISRSGVLPKMFFREFSEDSVKKILFLLVSQLLKVLCFLIGRRNSENQQDRHPDFFAQESPGS